MSTDTQDGGKPDLMDVIARGLEAGAGQSAKNIRPEAIPEVMALLEGKTLSDATPELLEQVKAAARKILGQKPMRREEPKVGRNEPCPCGSGKKFKKCCIKEPELKKPTPQ